MAHEPEHDDCPPPGNGGYEPLDGFRPYQGQMGLYHVYGEGNEHLQCPALVLSVNDGSLGSAVEQHGDHYTVNVLLFLNTLSGTRGEMTKTGVHVWVPQKPHSREKL